MTKKVNKAEELTYFSIHIGFNIVTCHNDIEQSSKMCFLNVTLWTFGMIVVMLSFVALRVIILSGNTLGVIMLNVTAPCICKNRYMSRYNQTTVKHTRTILLNKIQ